MTLALQIRAHDEFGDSSTKRSLVGKGFRLERVEFHSDDAYDFVWDGGGASYLAGHDILLADGETQVDAGRFATPRTLNSLTFLPEGCPISGWCKPGRRSNSYTAVTFGSSLLSNELGRDLQASSFRPEVYFKDARVAATLEKLGRLLTDVDAPRRAEAEALVLVAALEVHGRSVVQASPATAIGALRPEHAELVRAYIAEHLGHDISLEDMALQVGLSRFHFSRSFKAAFGVSPQHYLIDQRLQRAKELLARSDMPVGEIATVVGYRGLARFSSAFRGALGCSPTDFRRRSR